MDLPTSSTCADKSSFTSIPSLTQSQVNVTDTSEEPSASYTESGSHRPSWPRNFLREPIMILTKNLRAVMVVYIGVLSLPETGLSAVEAELS